MNARRRVRAPDAATHLVSARRAGAMHTGARWAAALLCAAALAGCQLFAEPSRVAPGTPAAQVLATLGAPTARYGAGPGGSLAAGERLQYSYQPAGQRVFNIDLDPAGRVQRVEQALDEALFAQRIRPGVWTQGDVLREYGPPARTMGVHNFDGTIWIWRYANGPFWRLLFIDIDRAGVVRGYSNGDEDLPEPRDAR